MAIATIRQQLRDDTAARLAALYGPAGTTGHWFKDVASGVWMPNNKTRPKAWVQDDGQRKGNFSDTENEKSLALGLLITIDLRENWRTQYDTWCNRTQEIITSLYNWLPGYGCLRMDYEEDDPFEVILPRGASEQIWTIRFTATYMHEVGIIGKA